MKVGTFGLPLVLGLQFHSLKKGILAVGASIAPCFSKFFSDYRRSKREFVLSIFCLLETQSLQ